MGAPRGWPPSCLRWWPCCCRPSRTRAPWSAASGESTLSDICVQQSAGRQAAACLAHQSLFCGAASTPQVLPPAATLPSRAPSCQPAFLPLQLLGAGAVQQVAAGAGGHGAARRARQRDAGGVRALPGPQPAGAGAADLAGRFAGCSLLLLYPVSCCHSCLLPRACAPNNARPLPPAPAPALACLALQEAACGSLATFLEEGEPERHMAPYMAAILQTLATALQVGGGGGWVDGWLGREGEGVMPRCQRFGFIPSLLRFSLLLMSIRPPACLPPACSATGARRCATPMTQYPPPLRQHPTCSVSQRWRRCWGLYVG